MVGITVVTHGNFAKGLHSTTNMIMGSVEQFNYVSLESGQSISVFYEEVLNAVVSVNDGDGVLVFVDIQGGTPFNTVLQCKKDLQERKDLSLQIITGVNLPVVLEALTLRNASSIEALIESIAKTAPETIQFF